MSFFKKLSMASALASTLVISAGVAAHGDAQTTTVRWGPVELPAGSMGQPGEVKNHISGLEGFRASIIDDMLGAPDYDMPKPCEDCYIVGIKPNLVLENGETANHDNGVMLHHVVNVNWSDRDITCRPNLFSSERIKQLGGLVGGNERFFAAGNERTVAHLEGPYGYHVGKYDEWGLIYHLMNMNPEPMTVYFEYEFQWVDASESDLKPVRPMWKDVDQCGDSEVDIPAGYNNLTWGWRADRTHTYTNGGGHIHNYGINTAWFNETKNEMLCNSLAGYAEGSSKWPVGPGTDADPANTKEPIVVESDPLGLENYNGSISHMTVCQYGEAGPKVDRRDQLMFNAQMYTPSEDDHAMGIMVSYLDEKFCLTDFWCF